MHNMHPFDKHMVKRHMLYHKYNIRSGVSTTCKELFDELDFYFSHLIEEVIEFNEENTHLHNTETIFPRQEESLELIDVMNYELTILASLEFNIFEHTKTEFTSYEDMRCKLLPIFYEKNSAEKSVLESSMIDVTKECFCMKLISEVIRLRQEFPERKRHKAYPAILVKDSINDLVKKYVSVFTLFQRTFCFAITRYRDISIWDLFNLKDEIINSTFDKNNA